MADPSIIRRIIHERLITTVFHVQRVATAAESLATGDLTFRAAVAAHDEVGHMAAAVNHGMENLRILVLKVAQTSGTVAHSSEELALSAEAVGRVAQQVSETIAQFATGIETQASAAAETERMAIDISSASRQVATFGARLAADARAAAGTAQSGREAVAETTGQMDIIRQTVLLAANARPTCRR